MNIKNAPSKNRLKKNSVLEIIKTTIRFFFPFLLVGIVWELAVRIGWITLASLPAPSTLIQRFWNLAFVRTIIWRHIGASLLRLITGYGAAVLIGILLGALLSLNSILHNIFEPTLNLLLSVPTIAWVPILLITLGLCDKTVITAIFISAFFPIVYNVMRGIDIIPPSVENAARMMGLQGTNLFINVFLPASMLSIINGLRLALGYAWRALVGAELLAALIEWGMGKMVFQARYFNDAAVMLVGLLVIGISGYLLDQIFLVGIERNTVEKWGLTRKKRN